MKIGSITCYEIMETGYDLLKEEVDVIYGIDTKDQVESVFHMAGIVDTVVRLGKLFEETETKEEDN